MCELVVKAEPAATLWTCPVLRHVDVFTAEAYRGNPVAVVMDGVGLEDETLQRFARWMNLSETTFILPRPRPGLTTECGSSLRVCELPFAGHPTLGTCHAWLEAGGVPRTDGVVVQECAAGLIRIRRGPDGLAFGAPPVIRSGAVDKALVEEIAATLGVDRGEIVDSQWVDNGPGWVAVMLRDAEAVLALAPGSSERFLGVVGAYPDGADPAFEVRAFFPVAGGVRRGPRHRKPERVVGRMAARDRQGERSLHRQPGHRDRPERARPYLDRRGRGNLDRGRRETCSLG